MKKTLAWLCAGLSVGYALLFGTSLLSGPVFAFAAEFLTDVFEVVAFLLAVIPASRAVRGKRLLLTFAVTAPRLFYAVPVGILSYLAEDHTTLTSVLLGVGGSVASWIGLSFVAFCFAVLCRFAGEKKQNDKAGVTPVFDLSHPRTFAIFLPVALVSLASFASEVVATVAYFVEAAGDYLLSEIVLMILSYLSIILALVLSQLFCVMLDRRLDVKN